MTAGSSVRITELVLCRIRREYLEMPGLCPTLEQAQRLWNLDEETCRDALQLLVETGFLCRAAAAFRGPDRTSAHTFRRSPLAAARLDRQTAA